MQMTDKSLTKNIGKSEISGKKTFLCRSYFVIHTLSFSCWRIQSRAQLKEHISVRAISPSCWKFTARRWAQCLSSSSTAVFLDWMSNWKESRLKDIASCKYIRKSNLMALPQLCWVTLSILLFSFHGEITPTFTISFLPECWTKGFSESSGASVDRKVVNQEIVTVKLCGNYGHT